MDIKTFLTNLGVLEHPGFRYKHRQEGYRNYTFGCRAGPSKANIDDLAHELAHAAQFGPEAFKQRAFDGGFCFKVPMKEVLGHVYVEPITPQATLRELDTFACQAHLLMAAGLPVDLDKHCAKAADLLTRWMHDWWLVPGSTEKERKAWSKAKALEFYERRSQADVLAALFSWLDLTDLRLKKLAGRKGELDVA